MSAMEDEDNFGFVINFVAHTIIANPNPVLMIGTLELYGTEWARFVTKQ